MCTHLFFEYPFSLAGLPAETILHLGQRKRRARSWLGFLRGELKIIGDAANTF
jgi:hypothetical protein